VENRPGKLSCVQLDIYRKYRTKYQMPAQRAYEQALLHTEPPEITWDDDSNYTHPTKGTVVVGPFTYKIKLIPDDDHENLRGKLTSAKAYCGDSHEPVQYEDYRNGWFCPYCQRPDRGEGLLITYREMHSGSREFAWFEPEDIDSYEKTRAYFIKAKYGKALADVEARRYLVESCKNAVKVLEGDISFLGVEVRAYYKSVSLGEASVWGFEYEGPESMEYIVDDGVEGTMVEALQQGLADLPDQIKSHEQYLRELYEVANAQNTDYRPLFILGPNAEKETK
jgi:hypothetical protein